VTQREVPRVGGIIEDETGSWRIVEVREDESVVILEDHEGTQVWRSFGNLGPVHYEPERLPEHDANDGTNLAESEEH